MELLDMHGRRLHRLLGRLTRSPDVAGDLMQELFIKLSQAKGLDAADDPYAYAWRAAVNLAFGWRRKQRISTQPLTENDRTDEAQDRPLARLIRDEQVERVLEAASRLDELARNVIVMRFIEQEPYDRIALQLDKDAGYLRSLCSKTLIRLRDMCAEGQNVPNRQGGAL